MYKRRALAALLLLALGCCSRHEHLTPINYSPPASAESSELGIRTAIVQQSIIAIKVPARVPTADPIAQVGVHTTNQVVNLSTATQKTYPRTW